MPPVYARAIWLSRKRLPSPFRLPTDCTNPPPSRVLSGGIPSRADLTSFQRLDGLADELGYRLRPILAVVEHDRRRGPLRCDGTQFLADDPMLHAETGATDPGHANAHVDRVRKG